MACLAHFLSHEHTALAVVTLAGEAVFAAQVAVMGDIQAESP